MYKLSVNNYETRESDGHLFDTLEQAQMRMLACMGDAMLEHGMDWAQVGEILLGLLYSASRGELCGALCCCDAPDVVVSPHWGTVYGCGASMSYVIEERG